MTYRAGIVGIGKMGSNHARVLSRIDNVQLVGYYDPITQASDPGIRRFDSIEELSREVDYFVVSSPTKTHLDNGLFAAKKQIPSLIEKPLALNAGEAYQLRDAFAASGTIAAVGMVERFNVAAATAKKRLERGEIGIPLHISTKRVGPYSGRIQDVGVGLDLATHDLDLIQWLLESKIAEINIQKSSIEDGPEDFLAAVGRNRQGLSFSSEVTWRSPIKNRSIKIFGSEGVLEANLLEMTLRIDKSANEIVDWENLKQQFGEKVGNSVILGLEKIEPLLLEHLAFLDLLDGNKRKELPDLDEAARLVELLMSD